MEAHIPIASKKTITMATALLANYDIITITFNIKYNNALYIFISTTVRQPGPKKTEYVHLFLFLNMAEIAFTPLPTIQNLTTAAIIS